MAQEPRRDTSGVSTRPANEEVEDPDNEQRSHFQSPADTLPILPQDRMESFNISDTTLNDEAVPIVQNPIVEVPDSTIERFPPQTLPEPLTVPQPKVDSTELQETHITPDTSIGPSHQPESAQDDTILLAPPMDSVQLPIDTTVVPPAMPEPSPKRTFPIWGQLAGGLLIFIAVVRMIRHYVRRNFVHKVRESTSIVSGRVSLGVDQNIGERKEQQDAFGISEMDNPKLVEQNGILAIVADGMGGLALGRQASNTAVRTFLANYSQKSPSTPIPKALQGALQAANEVVKTLATDGGQKGSVGTTIIAVVIHREQLFWVSVGDSRIYLLRNGQLSQLTDDHNYYRELKKQVANGIISEEDAKLHPQRKGLTSFIGIDQLVLVDANSHPLHLEGGERLLLSSDGLYGSLRNEEIVELLTYKPQEASEALVQKAISKKRPQQDNITAVVMGID